MNGGITVASDVLSRHNYISDLLSSDKDVQWNAFIAEGRAYAEVGKALAQLSLAEDKDKDKTEDKDKDKDKTEDKDKDKDKTEDEIGSRFLMADELREIFWTKKDEKFENDLKIESTFQSENSTRNEIEKNFGVIVQDSFLPSWTKDFSVADNKYVHAVGACRWAAQYIWEVDEWPIIPRPTMKQQKKRRRNCIDTAQEQETKIQNKENENKLPVNKKNRHKYLLEETDVPNVGRWQHVNRFPNSLAMVTLSHYHEASQLCKLFLSSLFSNDDKLILEIKISFSTSILSANKKNSDKFHIVPSSVIAEISIRINETELSTDLVNYLDRLSHRRRQKTKTETETKTETRSMEFVWQVLSGVEGKVIEVNEDLCSMESSEIAKTLSNEHLVSSRGWFVLISDMAPYQSISRGGGSLMHCLNQMEIFKIQIGKEDEFEN